MNRGWYYVILEYCWQDVHFWYFYTIPSTFLSLDNLYILHFDFTHNNCVSGSLNSVNFILVIFVMYLSSNGILTRLVLIFAISHRNWYHISNALLSVVDVLQLQCNLLFFDYVTFILYLPADYSVVDLLYLLLLGFEGTVILCLCWGCLYCQSLVSLIVCQWVKRHVFFVLSLYMIPEMKA